MVAEQLKNFIVRFKDFWEKLSEKSRKTIIFGGAGVLVFAICLTLLLNVPKMGYKVLFPGMSTAETTQVLATLTEMGVKPQMDSDGNIRVPSSQWDDLQYQLSAQGYPKTTLTYDIFSNMSGFTTTEFEKRVALTYQLQDRIQDTLKKWEGISDVTLTINIPETSNLVWNQSQQEPSTASASVVLRPGYTLSPQQVSAIKNHIASAVPRLIPQNVVVIDAATGIEPASLESESAAGTYSVKRLEFERLIEKNYEDSVKRLLVPSYGADKVNAVAKVVVDYDKVLREIKEWVPEEDGNGVASSRVERYDVNGNPIAEGIPGEENNTDIPRYPNLSGLEDEGITSFERITDYEISYIMTQIEKGEPLLTEASIAVLVDDDYLNAEKEDLLVDLISKSVNIPPEKIRVANMALVPKGAEPRGFFDNMSWQSLLVLVGGGLVLVLIIIIFITIMMRGARKRRQLAAEAELAEQEFQRQQELEREISDHKRMLRDEAQAASNPKESAITQEVQNFAEHNPEITANLIRSLMKEDR